METLRIIFIIVAGINIILPWILPNGISTFGQSAGWICAMFLAIKLTKGDIK